MSEIELVAARGGPWRPDQLALPVAAVRRVEAAAMATLPAGTLMQRAAAGIDVVCAGLLRERTGGVVGRRVMILVGPGDNGGDALYAGARLARRGALVVGLLVAARHHGPAARAFGAAGGRLHQVDVEVADRLGLQVDASGIGWASRESYPYEAEHVLLARRDLVLDAILGIGGSGGLRGAAGALAVAAWDAPLVVSVDLPSGVDADSGAVLGAAVRAHRTVVMGVLKPGLLLGAGAEHAGRLTVVDIGLDLSGASDEPGALHVVDDAAAATAVPRPGPRDDKYTRGVVGVTAGSARYPGAAVLCAGAARHGASGYVRYAGPASAEVGAHWPDVVAVAGPPGQAGRVQCWVAGPGRGTDDDARQAVLDVLAADCPVLLDADALTVLSEHADVRTKLRARSNPTLLTPHAGEFTRLAGAVGLTLDLAVDRVGAVRALAAQLGVVVLLKGATTVVAPSTGPAHVVVSGVPELATAGTGDVLSGLLGSLLAHAAARAAGWSGADGGTTLSLTTVAAVAAAGAHLHGVAGRLAAGGGRPVAALDVLAALPDAVARVRAAAR